MSDSIPYRGGYLHRITGYKGYKSFVKREYPCEACIFQKKTQRKLRSEDPLYELDNPCKQCISQIKLIEESYD